MICPKCNIENDESSKVCKNCGEIIGQSVPAKRKFSKLAIISFVLGILSLLLTFLTGIPAIICSIISLLKIRKSDGLLRGKEMAVAALAISLIMIIIPVPLLIIWSIDAQPIWYDYNINDFRSAPEDCNESYFLIKSFENANYLEDPLEPNEISSEQQSKVREIFKSGAFQEIRQLIMSNSKQIEDAWINAGEYRKIIKKLNSYPEVADLSEPSYLNLLPQLANIRRLAMIYRSYILLQTELGNSEDAVRNLIELDSVIRKTSLNARGLVLKLVCIAVLAIDIKTANDIANNPKASSEAIELLAKHYNSFDNEIVSLKNCYINEYLMFKDYINSLFSRPSFIQNMLLKRNSTLRIYRNLYDSLIIQEKGGENDLLTVWPKQYPSFMPKVDLTQDKVPFIYKVYNPPGYMLIHTLKPAYSMIITLKTRLTIETDMLQIVLNQRLNRPVNLKARAYSDEYTIDVNDKKIISPGPDKKIGTDDDITMPIEPNLLNLVK